MQYAIRNVSVELDRALKALAKESGKSLNQLVLELLAQSLGKTVQRRDLHDMPGAWSSKEAANLDRALQEQRTVDDELWE